MKKLILITSAFGGILPLISSQILAVENYEDKSKLNGDKSNICSWVKQIDSSFLNTHLLEKK